MKERFRCITHSIPYIYYNKLMVRSLIACVVKLINEIPGKNLILSTIIQAMVVEGKGNPNLNHKHIAFGSYAMVYMDFPNKVEE